MGKKVFKVFIWLFYYYDYEWMVIGDNLDVCILFSLILGIVISSDLWVNIVCYFFKCVKKRSLSKRSLRRI